MSNDNNDNGALVCKVVLVGESSVGKTCITNRFVYDSFDYNEPTTISASYTNKIISFDEFQGKSIKFEIWDTVGQEKYRAITKIFYKDANIAILVYDITSRKTFEEIKNYWINQIKEHASKNTNKFYFKLI